MWIQVYDQLLSIRFFHQIPLGTYPIRTKYILVPIFTRNLWS